MGRFPGKNLLLQEDPPTWGKGIRNSALKLHGPAFGIEYGLWYFKVQLWKPTIQYPEIVREIDVLTAGKNGPNP